MQVSPRVNAGLVGQYINRPVRVVGTVQGYDENKTTMSLLASDGGLVQVILALQNQGMAWEIGAVVEVIGQAQGNQQPTLQEYTSIPFSKDFNLANYDKLVQLMNGKHQALFM